jgi:hypothetical protein
LAHAFLACRNLVIIIGVIIIGVVIIGVVIIVIVIIVIVIIVVRVRVCTHNTYQAIDGADSTGHTNENDASRAWRNRRPISPAIHARHICTQSNACSQAN